MRISQQEINDAIRRKEFKFFENRVTVAFVTLTNGYIVTGESSCLDPAEFDAGTGARLAMENALGKIGALLAFRACDRRAIREDATAVPLTALAGMVRTRPAIAWQWHCDIVAAIQDAAAKSLYDDIDAARLAYVASEAASRFMRTTFGASEYAPPAMRAPGLFDREPPDNAAVKAWREGPESLIRK